MLDLCHLNDLVFNTPAAGLIIAVCGSSIVSGGLNRQRLGRRQGLCLLAGPGLAVLIDNALFLVNEYRVDGIRYSDPPLWRRSRLPQSHKHARHAKPEAIQIAEYWDWDRCFQ